MNITIEDLIRPNILALKPYATARHEFSGVASVFLDANENALGAPVQFGGEALHRYPDPQQAQLKTALSNIKGISASHIFVGNGSDEAIDVLMRIFCEPGVDNMIVLSPTYGMYTVSAAINNIAVKEVMLDADFQIDLQAVAAAVDDHTKLLFICSPNNPSGNSIRRQDIEMVLHNFDGIVVLDEAYINYAKQKSFIADLAEHNNLVILQTLSKAWGLAGLRVGLAFAHTTIIQYMNEVKYPYNLNATAQTLALQALENIDQVNAWTKQIVAAREQLAQDLQALPFVQKVYPSDANFLLAKMQEANAVFHYLQQQGIIVRNRSSVKGCEGCLRITVGTPSENKTLLQALQLYKNN